MKEHADRPEAQEAVTSLLQSFQENWAKQGAVWEKLSQITKDESIRFTQERISKTTKTLEQFGNDGGNAKSLMAGQQQWLQEMVKDYAGQSVRYTQMFGEIATSAFSASVANSRKAARKGQDLAEEGAVEVEKTADVIRRSGNEMAEQGRESFSREADSMNRLSDSQGNLGSDYNTN